jgi:hypothetical protein
VFIGIPRDDQGGRTALTEAILAYDPSAVEERLRTQQREVERQAEHLPVPPSPSTTEGGALSWLPATGNIQNASRWRPNCAPAEPEAVMS